MPNFHTLKRYSHQTAPKKLIPAIIACKCVPYLLVFGFVVCFCGLIPVFLFNQSQEQSVDKSESINKTFNEIKAHFNQTVDQNNESIDENYDYIFYACLGLGSLLILCGVICLMIAYHYFRIYQEDRIRHIQVTDLDTDQTQTIITDPIIDGIGYPINLINKSKQSEYFPVSQTNNVVYNSTTEPIK